MHTPKKLWKRSNLKTAWKRSKLTTLIVLFQYLLVCYLLYATFIIEDAAFKIAIGALAVSFAGRASSDISEVLSSVKLDKILNKLKRMERAQKTRLPKTR